MLKKSVVHEWSEEERQAVADGRATLSELAARFGLSRQSAHRYFKRRGWPVKAIARVDHPAGQHLPGARKPPQSRQNTREVMSGSWMPGDSESAVLGDPGATNRPFADDADGDPIDAGQAVREAGFDVAYTVLLKARDLAQQAGGAQSLRAVASAANSAIEIIKTIGIPLDGMTGYDVPALVIREMTSEEAQEIRNSSADEYAQEFGDDVLTDDAALEPDRAPSSTDEAARLADTIVMPIGLIGAPQPPPRADLDGLGRALRAAVDKHGRPWLRSQTIAHGITPANDLEATIAAILEAARRNGSLAAKLEATLRALNER